MAARRRRPRRSFMTSSFVSPTISSTERMLDQAPEDLALVGLGGTGRGEMAPFSDLDLMFLTAKAPAADQERAAEAILHLFWDLKLKVGHSVRSVPQLIALAKKDMTIRTAFLEARWLWGEKSSSTRPRPVPQGRRFRDCCRIRRGQAR